LETITKGELVELVGWVLEAFPLSDLRDVAVGFVIGVTMDQFWNFQTAREAIKGRKPDSEDYNFLMEVFKERLPDIIEKIEKEFCE
jgi:hypothetical protein